MTVPARGVAVLAPVALGLGLAAWLWPIGLGGRMPVGGDVTQFSMGLMAELARALRDGRLPLWNDLWGFGFPGLAESQMGVFYPPHWILYGLFGLEAAYTASLVLHTAWGGLGAYWASRKFAVSPVGAALAGFAWATSGFFVIHLPHQWGYTVGSWMPWAWGLTWTIATGQGGRRAPLLLALVLTLQVLPGHFQLAFCTQVGVVLLALGAVSGRSTSWRGIVGVLLCLLAALPLAAAQLWPTYRLARLAAGRRDFEYLSGFAATPLHAISYLAPGLFQRSPLWRPLAWDPFHTSPEEYLAYIGLVPLFLALTAVVHGLRRDPAVRALAVVAIGTLLLSLGPYVPGFDLWRRLPGFSFFRAPARWSLATELALALLAGKGFAAWRDRPRPGRSLARFAILSSLAIAVVVLGVELAVASTGRPGWPAIARGFQKGLEAMPWWSADKERPEPSFRELMLIARRPLRDARVQTALARQAARGGGPTGVTFTGARFAIYRKELVETGTLLILLLALAPLAGRRRFFETALIALTVVDLGMLGHHRPIDLGPIRPLTKQSRVLARLAQERRGARTVDGTRSNLPMVAGAAPIAAYRTLDLPALTTLTALAQAPLGHPGSEPAILGALRASGASFRVLDPFETAQPVAGSRERVDDPALAGWLYGADLVAQLGPSATRFTVWRLPGEPATAWRVPLTPGSATTILKPWSGRPEDVIESLDRASPLPTRRPVPERLEIDVVAEGSDLVVVSQLADPQWRARWVGPNGEQKAELLPAFARPGEIGWQAVKVPGPGRWTLRMEYRGEDVLQGLAISAVAWICWGLAFVGAGRTSRRVQDTSQ